ncbi:MAG: hypothetical protein V3W43_11695, partial [Desulfatiglandaceae bacterium]
MRRWNGWGEETINFPLPDNAHRFLVNKMCMGSSIKGRVKRKNTPFAPFSLLYTMRRNLYS